MAAFAKRGSDELRRKGNELYKESQIVGLAPCLRTSRLRKAISLYSGAETEAFSRDERASASKNKAIAYRDLCLLLQRGGWSSKNAYLTTWACLVESLESAEAAAVSGLRCGKDQDWLNVVQDCFVRTWQAFLRFLGCDSDDDEENAAGRREGQAVVTRESLDFAFAALRQATAFASTSASVSGASHVPSATKILAQAGIALLIGKTLFNHAVTSTEEGSTAIASSNSNNNNTVKQFYATGLSSNKDASQYFRQTLSLCREVDQLGYISSPTPAASFSPFKDAIIASITRFRVEAAELEESAVFQEHMCGSVLSRLGADHDLQAHLQTEEEPNMDFLWSLADHYKHAALLTRGQDLESEAIALARLASLYHEVLLIKASALHYAKKAMELGDSLAPKDVTNSTWYQNAEAIVFRALLSRPLSVLSEEELATIKEELKPALKELDSTANHAERSRVTRIRDVLFLVYAKYPPKNKAVLGSTKAEHLKRTLVNKAILHYHPDKQLQYMDMEELWTEEVVEEEEGTRPTQKRKAKAITFHHWVVLCEAITSHLNALYTETYKGGC